MRQNTTGKTAETAEEEVGKEAEGEGEVGHEGGEVRGGERHH